MFRTRKAASRLFPRSFRRGLRVEWLEDRTTPTTLFVDDSLVAGPIAGLGSSASVTQDRGTIGTLDAGDQVSIAVGETGTTATLTFRTTAATGSTTPAVGDTGVVYSSIQTALDAALADGLTDVTIEVAKGTYTAPISLTNPAVNSLTQLTIDGLTGVATDVVIDPSTAAAGITLDTTAAAVTGGITLSDLQVTGATNGVVANGIADALTLTNVQVGTDVAGTGAVEANTGTGLQLTGTGAGTTVLTLTGVTVKGSTSAKAVDVSGFAAVNLTDLGVTAGVGAPQSTISLPAALANASLSVGSAATAGQTFTATPTSLQVGPTGGTAGEAISLANVDALNLTGGSGADTFVVTPAATGGAVITINGGLPAPIAGAGAAGDVIDLTTTAGLVVSATPGVSGFGGSITSGATADVNFSNVESFADGSTVSGRVLVDSDKDNTADANEGGLLGVTVYLDLNNNDTLDAGDLSTTTDAGGNFSFAGLPPQAGGANYAVRIVTPTGATAVGGVVEQPVAVNSLGAVTTPANFLLQLTSGGTVRGVVFNDQNGNGSQNGTEGPLAGVTVFLDLNGNGNLDASTEPSAVTDATGAFTLTTTQNGTFTVRANPPLPSGLTLPATLPTVNLSAGNTVTQNLGLVSSATVTTGGTVTGRVYSVVSSHGVRGVTVYLDLNGNGRLDKTEPRAVTDANGFYTLTTTQDVTQVAVRPLLSPGYLRSTTPPTVTLTGGAAVSGQDIGLVANLPPQATPARRLAAGFIIGGQAHVKFFDDDGKATDDVTVFPGLNVQDVRVAVADVTGDGVEDIIVGTGPGVPTQVVILDGTTLQEIARLTPFEAGFTGGVFVAAGDLNGDGIADVIITPDEGGGPRVLVFQGGQPGTTGAFTQIASFLGIDDLNFRGGARVAVADFNRDGIPDLVVAAGFGGGPRVAVYDGSSVLSGSLTRLMNDFFVFEDSLRNGAFITAGDVDGDGFADLIAGGGPGGAPRVLALSGADLLRLPPGQAKKLANFFAGDSNDRGGVRVTAKDLDGSGTVKLIVGSGKGGGGKLTAFNLSDQSQLFSFDSDADNLGGVFVG